MSTDELGQQLRPDDLRQRFTTLTEAAGLPVIRVHDLRHTYVTLALTDVVLSEVVRGGIEPPTPRFSVVCSTN